MDRSSDHFHASRSSLGWRSTVLGALFFALTLFVQTTFVHAFGQPHCPGRWANGECFCSNGQEAQAYECSGNFCFRCPQPRRRQIDSRVHCGGGQYCPQGSKCGLNGTKCLRPDDVDCGNYVCKASYTCGKGWKGCVAKGANDCGPKVKGSCKAGTTCFTPTVDQLKGYEKGKTYCLTPKQQAKVKEKLDDVVGDLREKVKARRAERKRKREEEKLAESKKKQADEPSKKQTADTDKKKSRTKTAKRQTDDERKQAKRASDIERAQKRQIKYAKRAAQKLEDADKAQKAGDIGRSRRLQADANKDLEKYARYKKKYDKLKSRRAERERAQPKKQVAAVEKEVSAPPVSKQASRNLPSATPEAKALPAASGRSDGASGQDSGTRGKSINVQSANRAPIVEVSPPKNSKSGSISETSPRDVSPKVRLPSVDTPSSTVLGQKTPVKIAMEKEILRQYGDNRRAIKKVADNADYALIAAAAYHPNDSLDARLSNSDWKRIDDQTDKKFALTGSNVATVYHKNDEVVVAFQGSNGPGDWLGTNAQSLTFRPSTAQVRWAKKVARKAVDDNPGKTVTFVGHSLGARLAQVARTETGANAVVFNSAPLSVAEAKQESLSNKSGTLTSFRSPPDLVSKTSGEQRGPIVPYSKLTGNTSGVKDITVSNFITGSQVAVIQNHDIDQLADSMQTVKDVYSWMEK